MELTISARTLRGVLEPLASFAGDDYVLPVLNAVHLRVTGGDLIGTATDRFVVAMIREKGEWPEGWQALVPVPAVRAILRAFRPKRGEDPDLTLTLDDDGRKLRVATAGGFGEFAEASLTYFLEAGEFPKNLGSIIVKSLGDEPTATGTVGLNPGFLAKFAAIKVPALAFRVGGSKQPVVITDGERFIGAIMPKRVHDNQDGGDFSVNFDQLLAEVSDIYAEPKPPAKKRAATRKKAS